jgi:hypothetical protein
MSAFLSHVQSLINSGLDFSNNGWGKFLLGVAGTLLGGWGTRWFNRNILKPKAAFDTNISRTATTGTPTRPKYRIKFWNAGRRDILDVTISARLHVQKGTNRNSYSIPLGYASLPKIYPSSTGAAKLREKKATRTHITILKVTEIEELQQEASGKDLVHKMKQIPGLDAGLLNADWPEFITRDDQLLEHLLQLAGDHEAGDGAWLEVTVMGYDSLSGTREVNSQRYSREQITRQKFREGAHPTRGNP